MNGRRGGFGNGSGVNNKQYKWERRNNICNRFNNICCFIQETHSPRAVLDILKSSDPDLMYTAMAKCVWLVNDKLLYIQFPPFSHLNRL